MDIVNCDVCETPMEEIGEDVYWCPECGTTLKDGLAGIWRSPNRALSDVHRKEAEHERE